MKFVVHIACALLVLLLAPVFVRADLQSDITALLQDKTLQKAEVGIEIIRIGKTPEDSPILFRHNSDIPLIPASNLKLVTTSAALDKLGPDFKFRTMLVTHGNDLILVGDGDPAFGDAELLKKVGWDTTTVFKNWAAELQKRQITSVARVLVDDSVFDENFAHPDWPADQLHKRYVAEVAGFNLNANCLDFMIQVGAAGSTVSYALDPATHYATIQNTCISGGDNAIWLSRRMGTNNIVLRGTSPVSPDVPVSVTVNDPPLFAATVFSEQLADSGIKVTGGVARDRSIRAILAKGGAAAADYRVVAIHETPLPAVIARANKDSMNLYAECLCKRLGFEESGQSGSWTNGTAAVAAFLKSAGIPDAEYTLDDGCGLSKKNRISANAIAHVLLFDHFSKGRQVFFDTLSVAGSDGTLKDRFAGTDLRGRVFGKTGYVNNVSCLSGYLHATDDQWYIFAILMNDLPPKTIPKPLQEQMVKAIEGK